MVVNKRQFGLPRQLEDDLLLRWATPDDTEELVEFNFRYHNDSPGGQPELWLKDWTRELMSGHHPTTKPDDFSVVVDKSRKGKIVSAAVLISQKWSIDGLEFPCGRPELIATDEAYRRRGLVRVQFDAIHARSEARSELVQAITGIPWYYRQFGYEMAIDLGGSRSLPFARIKALEDGQKEAYRLRPAKLDDIPQLSRLYDKHCEPSLLRCERDEATWIYEVSNALNARTPLRNREIVETLEGDTVGYAEIINFPHTARIRELAFTGNYSLRDICLFLGRTLKRRSQSVKEPHEPATELNFALGQQHPAYEALEAELSKPKLPYAWFVRVLDVPAFLIYIKSILEKRISDSVMSGYGGHLRLNFYRQQIRLEFKGGRLTGIDPYQPEHFMDGDAFFPGLSFLQLLFGYRSLDELKYAFADCFTKNSEADVLLPILFPKIPSHISMLS
jgi:hypothetical protein